MKKQFVNWFKEKKEQEISLPVSGVSDQKIVRKPNFFPVRFQKPETSGMKGA